METKEKKTLGISLIFDILVLGFIIMIVLFMNGNIPGFQVEKENARYTYGLVEMSIIILSSLILSAIFHKICKKKTKINTIVFLLVFSYMVSLFFTILKKFLFYYLIEKPIDRDTYLGTLLNEFKFSSLFAAFTCYLMYLFFMELFGKTEKRERFRKIILILTLIGAALQFINFTTNMDINRIISMGSILFLSLYTYTPIAIKSYKMTHRMKKDHSDQESKQIYYGFYFLFLIALFLVLLWLSSLTSIFWDIFTDSSYGPFYKLQLIFTICMLFNVYFGFVMPKWFKNYLLK